MKAMARIFAALLITVMFLLVGFVVINVAFATGSTIGTMVVTLTMITGYAMVIRIVDDNIRNN